MVLRIFFLCHYNVLFFTLDERYRISCLNVLCCFTYYNYCVIREKINYQWRTTSCLPITPCGRDFTIEKWNKIYRQPGSVRTWLQLCVGIFRVIYVSVQVILCSKPIWKKLKSSIIILKRHYLIRFYVVLVNVNKKQY